MTNPITLIHIMSLKRLRRRAAMVAFFLGMAGIEVSVLASPAMADSTRCPSHPPA